MKKKFLALALTLAMLLGLMIPSAFAYWDYYINEDTGDYEWYWVPDDDDDEDEGRGDDFDYLTGVTVSPGSVTMEVGDCEYLSAWTSGTVDDSYVSFSWSSSNSSVASVSSYGTVDAKKAGTATITCRASYGGVTKTDTCYVTVTGSSGGYGYITSLNVTPDSSSTLYVGDSEYFYAATYFSDNTTSVNDVYYSWSSSNTSVATVSSGGYGENSVTVYAKKAGTATIKCTATYNGSSKTSSCTVTVTGSSGSSEYLSSVSISPSSTTIYTGDRETLSATVYGYCYVSDVKYTWSSNNTSVASVSSSGGYGSDSVTVYGNRAGTATITCKATYNGTTKTSTCYVTVKDSGGSLYISSNLPTSYSTTYGTSNTLSFNVSNSTGYSLSYQWYVDGSKNNSYGTSNTFNTKNLSVGAHTIYCQVSTSKGNYSTKTNTCTITVSSGTTTTTGSINNFKARYSYNNLFTDVYDANWFSSYVKTAYEYGLVNGKTANTYCPYDNFTVAEALKIAACIRSVYYTGTESALTNGNSTPYWYTIYVNYCISNGIINQGDFTNYNANCTRAQMAYIFSRCLPASELTAVRNVSIPDCNNTVTQYYSNIQTLYDAGIVSGDQYHAYNPTQYIKRSEVAKIVCTLTTPSLRDHTIF